MPNFDAVALAEEEIFWLIEKKCVTLHRFWRKAMALPCVMGN